MRHDAIEGASAILLTARRSGEPAALFPDGLKPRNAADAYEIQDNVARQAGPIRGWKTGAPHPDAEPSFAPIFTIRNSPACFPKAAPRLFGIEAELAFRMAHDLPGDPHDAEWRPDRDELLAAVASMHPAIELVESRFAAPLDESHLVDDLSKLADNLNNGALVLGPAIAGWRTLAIDLARPNVELIMDGNIVATTIGNSGGDPLTLLARLAGHAARRRGGLRAGEIVTTGSITGIVYARPDSAIRAEFGALGRVDVEIHRR